MKLFNLFVITALSFLLTQSDASAQATLKGNDAMVSAPAPAKITKSELTNLITDFKSTDNTKSMKAFATISEKLMTTLAIQKDEIRVASEAGKSVDKLVATNSETINFYNRLNGADANNPDGTINKESVLQTLNQLSAFLFK